MTTEPLNYPIPTPPNAGETFEVQPGLIWVRQHLPMALNHINVWLAVGDDECAVVDTGLNMKSSRQVWIDVLDTHAKDKPVSKVVATHLHPDHCGLAGWLTSKHDCPLYMTRSEYLLCRTLCFDSSLEVPKEALRFYHAAGMTQAQLDHYVIEFGGFGRAISPLPPSYRRLQQGDSIDLAGQQWNVIIGNGHSPEHACLYNESTNTLISGDQLLPRISSIIAVWPTEPEADPLADWLHSCRRLREVIPQDALILPSHGLPFYGARTRFDQLIAHHNHSLEELHSRCREPKRVIDVFDLLFKSKINDGNIVMAIGETLAHFNHLRLQGLITRSTDSQGIDWFEAA